MNIEVFREEYRKQKQIEEIVKSRKLSRPKTKKWQVATFFVVLPFLAFFAIALPLVFEVKTGYRILLICVSIFFVIEGYLRLCLIEIVKCYQHYAKEETRRRCKCIPSCSEYAILSLRGVFPLAVAIAKIKKRLYYTCDGEDYKIDFPNKKLEKKFGSKK